MQNVTKSREGLIVPILLQPEFYLQGQLRLLEYKLREYKLEVCVPECHFPGTGIVTVLPIQEVSSGLVLSCLI